MADNYDGYGYAKVYEDFAYGAGFTLHADEVAEENQDAQPNRHARPRGDFHGQEGEEDDEGEGDAEAGEEVADGEHARVLFVGSSGFPVNVDTQ